MPREVSNNSSPQGCLVVDKEDVPQTIPLCKIVDGSGEDKSGVGDQGELFTGWENGEEVGNQGGGVPGFLGAPVHNIGVEGGESAVDPTTGRSIDSTPKLLNVTQLVPPGWRRSISVPFPEGKLPVCASCKVFTLTRDVCRLVKGHTGLPWSTSWVCILTDSTVRRVNHLGMEVFIDGDYTVKDLNDNFNFQNLFQGDFGMYTPVCLSCKNTNRTKTYCRGKRSHGAIPWNTSYIYVTLKDDETKVEPDETVFTCKDYSVSASHVFMIAVSAHNVKTMKLDIKKPTDSNRRHKRAFADVASLDPTTMPLLFSAVNSANRGMLPNPLLGGGLPGAPRGPGGPGGMNSMLPPNPLLQGLPPNPIFQGGVSNPHSLRAFNLGAEMAVQAMSNAGMLTSQMPGDLQQQTQAISTQIAECKRFLERIGSAPPPQPQNKTKGVEHGPASPEDLFFSGLSPLQERTEAESVKGPETKTAPLPTSSYAPPGILTPALPLPSPIPPLQVPFHPPSNPQTEALFVKEAAVEEAFGGSNRIEPKS
ncbi:hypothetical protein TrST_g11496 [Triparma strigata]|uniref:Uncharacterized protein n=1 Tax=Triparma strigata TaxID=1606541 RepID=A0A9W6ZRM4_9STRA|nr:hypothetical protein TrST_g11496 [Triparma strigata]